MTQGCPAGKGAWDHPSQEGEGPGPGVHITGFQISSIQGACGKSTSTEEMCSQKKKMPTHEGNKRSSGRESKGMQETPSREYRCSCSKQLRKKGREATSMVSGQLLPLALETLLKKLRREKAKSDVLTCSSVLDTKTPGLSPGDQELRESSSNSFRWQSSSTLGYIYCDASVLVLT